MPFDSNIPGDADPVIAPPLRAQFNALKALIDALTLQIAELTAQAGPIGTIQAWAQDMPGVPALGAGWLECNGQVIADAESPMNGQFLPDLNGAQGGPPCFLRGGNSSGSTGGSETHSHAVDLNVNGGTAQMGADYGIFPPGSYNTAQESTLPTYYTAVWVMRVK